MIRTRFAPSPTGFLHIGGARTALFAWAYALKQQGTFILRVEDTDIERSTPESVASILQAMQWLGLNYHEGPYFQSQRLARYHEVIQQLLANDAAYYCYCSKDELEQMRNEQRLAGQKPRYDQRCRHRHFTKQTGPINIAPVVRFKNPQTAGVAWHDLVKGNIEIANSELDDLIIARSDGSPTYNLCVVVDDWDMNITHVIRGDDHANNTPGQINILRALNAAIPQYAHLPMILRADGQKMSKRHDPVSVIEYRKMGILPEALLNYLARLCWGHGNDEIFNMEQFISWFNLEHISAAPARFDMQKLYWVNKEHLKLKTAVELVALLEPVLIQAEINPAQLDLVAIIELIKNRHDNLNSLVQEIRYFYQPLSPNDAELAMYLDKNSLIILKYFTAEILTLNNWQLHEINSLIKQFCQQQNIKLPQLAMPLRLKLCGTTQTPSLDKLLWTLGKATV